MADPPGLELSVIADEALVAVVGHGDPLSDRETIGLGDLAGHTLISMPVGSGMRTVLDETCAAAGVRPRIALEATDPRMLARLATRGLGVAIVPASTAHEHADELHALTIVRPGMRGRLALAWRAEGHHSTAARTLIAAIRHQRGAL